MLNLESFVHRRRLAGIISRWMIDQPRPDDVRQIKRIVNYNSYIARIWGDHLAKDLLTKLHGAEPRAFTLKTKGELKDIMVSHPSYTNARIEQMRSQYSRFPEDFYRETPIDGACYTVDVGGEPMIVGCTRIKRFRRIAEKGSRRIVDFMLTRIRANADALADERARSLGIPRAHLLTPKPQMEEEFRHAERRVIKSIKRGTIHSELPVLSIPDVTGAKVIVEDSDYPRLLEVLGGNPACRIIEIERHTGHYNAVNLRLAYQLPRELLLSRPPVDRHLRVLAYRGFDPATVAEDYRNFIEEAEETIFVEIIVSNFQEYLESEIGRCMHEDRVLSQRSHPDYNGHLATNVRHLMDYILGLCRAPGMKEISDVPIKLWVRYMPETIEQIMAILYVPEDVFFDAVPADGGDEPAAPGGPLAAAS